MNEIHSFSLKIKPLLLRLGIVFCSLNATRILFYVSNRAAFEKAGIADFFFGAWIDLVTICLYFFPFIVIEIFPLSLRYQPLKEKIQAIHFHSIHFLILVMNLMDVEYFKFTNKRTTSDLFSTFSESSDFNNLLLPYLLEFWWLSIVLVGLFWGSIYLYRKAKSDKEHTFSWLHLGMNWVFLLPLVVVVGRGGFGLKPISTLDVSKYCQTEQVPLVLNTPFCMLKSFGKAPLEYLHFMSLDKERMHFNPVQTSRPINILPDKQNVVIIILESFGSEFTGSDAQPTSYSPFFDSICKESLFFDFGIANGRKSIEALPAVIGSMPSWMDDPFITSPYCNNKQMTLPRILKKKGYSSAFFHSANNGSMRFDSYASLAGFDRYFGRNEYGNDAHFNGIWGIWDGYFNPWAARKISSLSTPFFCTLFTISSHHPYTIPPNRKDKVIHGPQPICAAINYSDWALKQFFEVASKQAWYKNTLFVLVADHTPPSTHPLFGSKQWMYRIPIAFYHPSGKIQVKKEQKFLQQIDIMPTLLDILNIKTTFYGFGKSYFQGKTGAGMTYLEGTYHLFYNEHMAVFKDNHVTNLYNVRSSQGVHIDSLAKYKQTLSKDLTGFKALMQRYNRDLIDNKTFQR
jgi:hypothetical protein